MTKSKLAMVAELILDKKDDAYWRITSTNPKGISTTKTVSHEIFVNTLKSNTIVRKEAKKVRLGRLPYGYVDCMYGREGSYTIAVLYPAKKRGIRYFKDTYLLPHPNLLFIYEIKKGAVTSKRCFAVKDKEITDNTLLWQYPFGNVDGRGGMCYGNIKIPNCAELSSIDELVQLFLSGDVNDDLYRPEHTTLKKKQFEVYKYLEKRKTFPEKILVPTVEYGYYATKTEDKRQLTFKDVFLSGNRN